MVADGAADSEFSRKKIRKFNEVLSSSKKLSKMELKSIVTSAVMDLVSDELNKFLQSSRGKEMLSDILNDFFDTKQFERVLESVVEENINKTKSIITDVLLRDTIKQIDKSKPKDSKPKSRRLML